MTRRMKQAMDRLTAVPESLQDSLADFLLHEIEQDEKWSASTAANSDRLTSIVTEVLEDDAAGRTTPLDPDRL
jgi:hypothetical protein